MEAYGYYTGIYSFANFLQGYLDMEALSAYDVWVADYRDPMKYPGPYGIWQHGHSRQPGRFWAGLYDTRPSAGAERKL